MLILGTCNPQGESPKYNGLYFRQDELLHIHNEGLLKTLPVKQEHTGDQIGTVISSFIDKNNNLQCLLEVDESCMQGSLAAGFVRDSIAKELSMGYVVDVQQSSDQLKATSKKVLEISLVRKGARENCQIHAFQDSNNEVQWTTNAWYSFDLS